MVQIQIQNETNLKHSQQSKQNEHVQVPRSMHLFDS